MKKNLLILCAVCATTLAASTVIEQIVQERARAPWWHRVLHSNEYNQLANIDAKYFSVPSDSIRLSTWVPAPNADNPLALEHLENRGAKDVVDTILEQIKEQPRYREMLTEIKARQVGVRDKNMARQVLLELIDAEQAQLEGEMQYAEVIANRWWNDEYAQELVDKLPLIKERLQWLRNAVDQQMAD